MESRQILRLSQRLKLPSSLRNLQALSSGPRSQIRCSSDSQAQAHPIGDYYEAILSGSSPIMKSAPPTTATPVNSPTATPQAQPQAPAEPSILFSSRLSSPLERRSEIEKKSTLIAGIMVPPKPDEPDNCCMSGCVNCVWDRYRDEIEEWAVAKSKADAALLVRTKGKEAGVGSGLILGEAEKGAHHIPSVGGGSDRSWGTGLDSDFTSENLFENVPVGIREFMKQEKRLKEKHAREGTVG